VTQQLDIRRASVQEPKPQWCIIVWMHVETCINIKVIPSYLSFSSLLGSN